MNRDRLNFGIALCLVILAAAIRLLPHPDNFAPIAAVAIFGGALLPRRYALTVPLAAMVLTDLVIGMHDLILVTWGSYLLIALASNAWLKKPSLKRGVFLTLGSSLFFFATTNFAVWLFDGMYPHTLAGLAECFTLALPFFRNTLMSDAVYTAGLFGIYALSTARGERRFGFDRIKA
jgi:hypothetical protein